MKKKNTRDNKNSAGKAHALLAAYWVYRVLAGAGIARASCEVALAEGRSVLSRKCDSRKNRAGTPVPGKTNNGRDVRKASAEAGILKNPMVRSGARKVFEMFLKSQRVI